jgi:hypothetical protein
MEIYAQEPSPYVPDNITVPQFVFDTLHKARPPRKNGMPWLIQDETGKKFGEAEVRAKLLHNHASLISPRQLRDRTHGLANGLKTKYNIGMNEISGPQLLNPV